MSKKELTLQETQAMFCYVADKMIDSKEQLTAADKAIGDGDHGIGMANGFQAVKEKLENADSLTSVGDICKTTGLALMMSIGGASGAIFGTLYQGPAAALSEKKQFTTDVLAILLQDGLEAVQKRGRSKPGDKTMIDALAPAAHAAQQHRETENLTEALTAVSEAAHAGMEETKKMIAAIGRAKSLHERSLGHADPGAISVYLQLDFMRQFVASAA